MMVLHILIKQGEEVLTDNWSELSEDWKNELKKELILPGFGSFQLYQLVTDGKVEWEINDIKIMAEATEKKV